MTATTQDLDNAISALTDIDTTVASDLQALVVASATNTEDVQALLNKLVNAPIGPDLQAEVDKLNASTATHRQALADAQTTLDSLKASDLLVNPPAPPVV